MCIIWGFSGWSWFCDLLDFMTLFFFYYIYKIPWSDLYCIMCQISFFFKLPSAEMILDMTRPQGYKTFFMLNSTEHEISTAHKK